VLEVLEKYEWPGNVRELDCEVKTAAAFAEGPEIALRDLKPAVREAAEGGTCAGKGMRGLLEAEKRRRVERALSAAGGRKKPAARLLGMDKTSFKRLCRRLNLEPGSPGQELRNLAGTMR
jgi:transcriptional regulator of acetoin/glycerol metabolism